MSDRDEQSVSEEEIAEVRKWARVAWQTSRAPLRLIEKVDRLVAEREAAVNFCHSLGAELDAKEQQRLRDNQYLLDKRDALLAENAQLERRLSIIEGQPTQTLTAWADRIASVEDELASTQHENEQLKAQVERLVVESRTSREAANASLDELGQVLEGRESPTLGEAVDTFFSEMERQGGTNYYTAAVDRDGETWTLTLQRSSGLTPAQRIDDLEAQVEQLKADGERLDWLSTQHTHIFAGECYYDVFCGGNDLRAAIDLARKAQGGE